MAQPNTGSFRQQPPYASYSAASLMNSAVPGPQAAPSGMSPMLYQTMPSRLPSGGNSMDMFNAPSRSSMELDRPASVGPRIPLDPATRVPPPIKIVFDTVQIPEVDKLTDDQVAALLASEEKLEGFIASLKPLVDNSGAAARCKKLADEVEVHAARVAELRVGVESKREETQTALYRLEELRTKRREFDNMFSLSSLVGNLEECEQAANASSEEVVANDGLTPAQFAREYLKYRTEYHLMHLKSDTLGGDMMM